MYKVLLADDEPLVLIGLQSMLKWDEFNMSICGSARNGEMALEMIENLKPDIVIIDIKMPRKNGLEVAKNCREKYGEVPVFIILTSYEEIDFLHEAIRLSAVDYLVKVELTSEMLVDALKKAVIVLKKNLSEDGKSNNDTGINYFYNNFFIRSLHALFENREQFEKQKYELNIITPLHAQYVVSYCKIIGPCSGNLTLYTSTIRMVKEYIDKICKNNVISLDIRHFAIIFFIEESKYQRATQLVHDAITGVALIVKNYFSVNLLCSSGPFVDDLFDITKSYNSAKVNFINLTPEKPFSFFSGYVEISDSSVFNISLYKEDLIRVFEEIDCEALHSVVNSIIDNLRNNPVQEVKAMDAACSLLYTAISFIPNGNEEIDSLFLSEEEGYRCIYRKRNTSEIIEWIELLGSGLCSILTRKKEKYKNSVILQVKNYIKKNIDKKIYLKDVASLFCFTPNYFSQLFAKIEGCTFIEFVTKEKIQKAKMLLRDNDVKVYEVSERLGFESAFYFSKVFKKSTGYSPTDFQKNS